MKNDKYIPLVYLVAAALIAAGFHILSVPSEMTALIVGAAITRVRIGEKQPKNGGNQNADNQRNAENNR